jgi:hypothetical protein
MEQRTNHRVLGNHTGCLATGCGFQADCGYGFWCAGLTGGGGACLN